MERRYPFEIGGFKGKLQMGLSKLACLGVPFRRKHYFVRFGKMPAQMRFQNNYVACFTCRVGVLGDNQQNFMIQTRQLLLGSCL